jgi:hypothetical protein
MMTTPELEELCLVILGDSRGTARLLSYSPVGAKYLDIL